MTIQAVTEFLGWMTVINIIVLSLSTLAVITLRDMMANIRSRLFGLDEAYLGKAYFQYLGQLKVAIIVFNIAPYIALKIMA